MTDIEQRIEEKTAAKLRVHNLKQAYGYLQGVRLSLKSTRELAPDFDAEIGRIIVNEIEILMWKIETAIREGGSK